MTILGIDPGYAIAGWGVVSKEKHSLKFIGAGCIVTPKEMPHAERLRYLSEQVEKLIKQYHPAVLAVEELFFFKNLKTALKVAEARGVILAMAMKHTLVIKEFTPLQIKQAVTSYGRADKTQMQKMVKVILNLPAIIRPDDAADAVAAAITCASCTRQSIRA